MTVTTRELLAFLLRPCPRTWRLRVQLDYINRFYGEKITAARKTMKREQLQQLYEEREHESAPIEEELSWLETRWLLDKARRLHLPVPETPTGEDEDADWIRMDSGRWCLKPEGHSKIRALIRAESKEQREALIAYATLIIGIIGALTGLIAVWRK